MAPLQRLAFLALRRLRLALDTLADVTLFYAGRHALGADAIADVYSATATPRRSTPWPWRWRRCYGSQHLRFNGEWLLGLGLGQRRGLARKLATCAPPSSPRRSSPSCATSTARTTCGASTARRSKGRGERGCVVPRGIVRWFSPKFCTSTLRA